MTSRISRSLVFGALCLLGVSTVYPLLFMAINSMRTTQAFEVNPFGLPTHLTLASYRSLFSTIPFLQSIGHSLIVVVPAVLLATMASSLAAFVFTKTPVKLGTVLFWTMLMIMFMPGIVVLLPLYVEVARTGLANNFAPAILIYTAINIPYGTYLLRSNFRSIPDSVVEAARVDGASWFKVYWRVILPIGKPGIITVGILTFLNIWNDLFISLGAAARAQHRDGDPDAGPAVGQVHLGHPGDDGGPAARRAADAAALHDNRAGVHPRHALGGGALSVTRRPPIRTPFL